MATQETQKVDSIIAGRRALLAAGGAAMAGLAFSSMTGKAYAQSTVTDSDILNFALNLEYLEAQFYTLASAGVTADSSTLSNPISINSGAAPITKGTNNYASCKVPFTNPLVQSYALEIAFEERNHVLFLQSVLSSGAVAQPSLDLLNSFNTLGQALPGPVTQSSFDPFASDLNFLIGAYIFEDVGVSAYHGAAGLIQDKTNVLPPAAQIHATEAYHAGLVRTTIYTIDQANGNTMGEQLATGVSAVRAKLDGTSSTTPDDVGLTTKTVALEGGSYTATTQINADANYVCWARTTAQVLSIVYAGGSGKGGFFPNGLNGNIK